MAAAGARPLADHRDEPARGGTHQNAGNAFATKITFINEIADLCEKVGADVQEVARGIGLDNRIGAKFLHAGPGYGGSCFPKDTLALLKTAQDHDAPQRIVEAVVAVNDNRKRAMGRKVIAACGGDVRARPSPCSASPSSPNTDDMRDSPAIAIVQTLQDAGATVRAYDPEGTEQAQKVLSDVHYCGNAYEAMDGADALVIVTEWDAFRALDLARVKTLLILLRRPRQSMRPYPGLHATAPGLSGNRQGPTHVKEKAPPHGQGFRHHAGRISAN